MKSQIARELTGMTGVQLHNADFRTSRSSKDIDTRSARNIRLSTGLIVSPEDQNELRKVLRVPPRCFE
jgi:hypothetical protein